MAGDAETLYQQGVRAIRDDNPSQGRRLLVEALRENPDNDTAWVLLSHVVDDPRKKVDCVDRALAINPANKQAQEAKKRIATGEYPTITGGKKSTQPMPAVSGKKSTQPMPAARTRTAELPVTRSSDLGRLVMSVEMNKWQLTQKIIYALGCIGLSAFFFYVSRNGIRRQPDTTDALLLAVSFAPLLALIPLVYSIVMTFGIKVNVHENGIQQTHVGTTKTWHWEDFTALRIAEQSYTYRYYGFPVYRLHMYNCRLMQDKKVSLHLNKNIQKYREVGKLVTQKTLPIFFERNYEAHRRGETVYYGKVQVNREGIRDGRRSIGWDEIASYDVENGMLIIQKHGRGKFRLKVLDMPNAYVLMAMIDKITSKGY